MRTLKAIALAFLGFAFLTSGALAQGGPPKVVGTCGTLKTPQSPGYNGYFTVDPNGVACTQGGGGTGGGGPASTVGVTGWGGSNLALANPTAVGTFAPSGNVATFMAIVNQTQRAGVSLGAPSAVGTEGTGNVETVNARITNSTPLTINETQRAGVALGAPTAVGTEGSGNVPTTNARITNPVGTPVNVNVVSSVSQNPGTITVTRGCTIGTSSASCVIAGTYTSAVIQNSGPSNLIACRWNGTAILNDLNSVTLTPYQSYSWKPVPQNVALNCISQAAGQNVYAETVQ